LALWAARGYSGHAATPARKIQKMASPAPAVATDGHAPNDHVRVNDLVKVTPIYLRIAYALLVAWSPARRNCLCD
jgi:acetylornithine deacetylase/succinyl-diaminopimelate desuccinylase-like protein